MKFGFFALTLALSVSVFSLEARATETEWKCLSALQEELTRSNCVGKSFPVGGGYKSDARGSFTCGFLHCPGEGALVGTNFYAYRAFRKDPAGQPIASSLCLHVDGKTQAFQLSAATAQRVNVEGYADIVGPQACRLSRGIGLAIQQNAQGELIQITQVKALGKNPELEPGSDYSSYLCENALSGKVYDAAYALGLKQGQNEKLKRNVRPVDPRRFITLSEICQSVRYFHNGLEAGKAAAKAQP